jgi:hypothetical protein
MDSVNSEFLIEAAAMRGYSWGKRGIFQGGSVEEIHDSAILVEVGIRFTLSRAARLRPEKTFGKIVVSSMYLPPAS